MKNTGNTFRVGMGAEAVKELLQAIDLEAKQNPYRMNSKLLQVEGSQNR